eukprot:scaffold96592_cov105-Phaeocystis_antarctica.AAC.1
MHRAPVLITPFHSFAVPSRKACGSPDSFRRSGPTRVSHVQPGDTRPELLRRARFRSTLPHMDTGLSQTVRWSTNRHSRGAWLRVDRAAQDVQLQRELSPDSTLRHQIPTLPRHCPDTTPTP